MQRLDKKMKLAKGSGTPLVLVSLFVLAAIALLVMLSHRYAVLLSVFLLAVLFVCFNFFRDPERMIAQGIVSPADGIIMDMEETKEGRIRVPIFMNVQNVHVNRSPISGTVSHSRHVSGSHVPAFNKESLRNERQHTIINGSTMTIEVVQIAGLLARRIVSYVKEGDTLEKGGKIGLIRFGSRVDILMPKTVSICVSEGDKVKAGSSTIALVPKQEKGGDTA